MLESSGKFLFCKISVLLFLVILVLEFAEIGRKNKPICIPLVFIICDSFLQKHLTFLHKTFFFATYYRDEDCSMYATVTLV